MRQEPTNIFGFSASPRAHGSTAWVVDTILEGAHDRGAQARFWSAAELDLKPCRACCACRTRDRRCAIHDDMPPVHASILESQALVLGAPIYMGQMSAQAKIMLDRLHPLFAPRFSPTFQEKNAGKALVLAFVQGNPDPERFRDYLDYTCRMFRTLEFDLKDTVLVTGTRSVAAQEQGGLHARLKAIGASLAP